MEYHKWLFLWGFGLSVTELCWLSIFRIILLKSLLSGRKYNFYICQTKGNGVLPYPTASQKLMTPD
ncbi:hypothetical protein FCR2A7T_08470 [Flavobacterium cauense R2A-7]|nr:hypothetical protein FCR2A7T_08470 [Flavobacterium cauense R2A-7]